MRRYFLILLLFCFNTGSYAQSISFFDLTNLANLSDAQAHNYLTLGKVFKHQYVETVDGKRVEHFRSVGTRFKEQNITIGVSAILKNGTALHTITYTTFEQQYVVNMIAQAKRSKLTLKFQGIDHDNNIFIFDNEFYRVDMYISTTDNKAMVKVNQKEFAGY